MSSDGRFQIKPGVLIAIAFMVVALLIVKQKYFDESDEAQAKAMMQAEEVTNSFGKRHDPPPLFKSR